MNIEKIKYSHYGECYKITNDVVDVIITADLGPRIICYKLIDGENILGELGPENVVNTEIGDWHPWGGHRLWHAPEAKPRSYVPDNIPVAVEVIDTDTVSVKPAFEKETGIQKEMIIKLDSNGTGVTVTHKVTNKNIWPVEMAPWGVTIMKSGGTTIVPQEPYIPHTDKLLPARQMALWHYTDFTDLRWKFCKKFILLKCDPAIDAPQKIGFANKQGWAAYLCDNSLFIKRFDYIDGALYPDYGSNFETFTSGNVMELESIGEMKQILPDETLVHIEKWYLFDGINSDFSEESIEKSIMPLVEKTI